MIPAPILVPRLQKPRDAFHVWLGRAERARRIAATLSAKDGEIIEAYARECEAEAMQAIDPEQAAIAA